MPKNFLWQRTFFLHFIKNEYAGSLLRIWVTRKGQEIRISVSLFTKFCFLLYITKRMYYAASYIFSHGNFSLTHYVIVKLFQKVLFINMCEYHRSVEKGKKKTSISIYMLKDSWDDNKLCQRKFHKLVWEIWRSI